VPAGRCLQDRVVDEESRPGLPPVLPVDYDLDLASAARVREQIAVAFAPGVRALIVDLTRCTFVETAGVAELVAAHKLGVARDARLAVVVPAALTRLFAITALDQYLRVFPTVAAALDAIG
jgi:anti-sigma B factor antagonist